MLFNVRGDMDRFDIFKIGETGSLAPVQELMTFLRMQGHGRGNGAALRRSLYWADDP